MQSSIIIIVIVTVNFINNVINIVNINIQGPSTFLLNDRPLIDNGGRIGTYYENRCRSKHCMSFSIFVVVVVVFIAVVSKDMCDQMELFDDDCSSSSV